MTPGQPQVDSTSLDRAIGARVRLRRIERGLSQEALAADAGLSVHQVRKCEGGKARITGAHLIRLAEPLQVSAGWLLEGEVKRAGDLPPPREIAHAAGSTAPGVDNPMLQACLVLAEEAFVSLPLAIYLTSSDGVILFCNTEAALLAGRAPRVGQDRWCVCWRAYDLDGKRIAPEEGPMAVALQTGRAVRGAVAVAERPDGSRQSFVPFPTPLVNRAGELFGGFNALYPVKRNVERAFAEAGA
ncbi:MAG: helix-turn-helix domain-containing protein [Vitreimonas sp.]